jgi:hypothetical protein
MCGLGFGGVRVLPPVGGFSCQGYLQCLSKIFTLQSSHYLLPLSSHHLGTSAKLLTVTLWCVLGTQFHEGKIETLHFINKSVKILAISHSSKDSRNLLRRNSINESLKLIQINGNMYFYSVYHI